MVKGGIKGTSVGVGGGLEDAGNWAGTVLGVVVLLWHHQIREGEGTLPGQALPRLWENPWGAAGATSTWRKRLAVPCRAFQLCPTWKSCSDAAPTPLGPCGDTQGAHGMTSDKGWCHISSLWCHSSTRLDQCCVHHVAVGALLRFFPIPGSSYTGTPQLNPPQIPFPSSIPWAPQLSRAGCDP